MTEKQALKQGLVFTGTYIGRWSDKDIGDVAVEAARIRKLGFRAVVVDEPHGKSVYSEVAYAQYQQAANYKRQLSCAEEQRAKMIERHRRELDEFDNRCKAQLQYIEEVETKYGKKVDTYNTDNTD